jgi:hypothetical protein
MLQRLESLAIMPEKNALKFQKPKPQPAQKTAATPRQRAGLIWLAVVLGLIAVWVYFQFLAPQSV